MGIWDIYARFYDALPKYYGPYQKLVEDVVHAVEGEVERGESILDAGCGTGNFSIELGRRGYNVAGIDLSNEMLKKSRLKRYNEGLGNIELKKWNIDEGLALYPDGTFGGIISINVLYTLSKPENALREYFRVLKPSGKLILAEPQHTIGMVSAFKEIYHGGGLKNVVKLALTQPGVGICNMLISRRQKSGRYKCWTMGEMRTMLADSGFGIESMKQTYVTNALALVNAEKPKYYFEMNGYRFASAETQEELDKVLTLRYQVYCLELGIWPTSENGIEKDEYDDHALHFIATAEDKRTVATLRVITENPKGFPMNEDFPLMEYIEANGIEKAVESGRFIIHKDVPQEDRGSIAFGLFKCLYEYCSETGIDDMFCTAWPGVVEKYKMPGLTQIGEPFRYSKLLGDSTWQVPLHCRLKQAYEIYLKQQR